MLKMNQLGDILTNHPELLSLGGSPTKSEETLRLGKHHQLMSYKHPPSWPDCFKFLPEECELELRSGLA